MLYFKNYTNNSDTEQVSILNTLYPILLFFLCLNLSAQTNTPIGTWQTYFSYNIGNTLAVVDQQVWVGTPNSYLMAFDFEDGSLRSLTNLNSFAEPEVSVIRQHPEKDWTLVAYDNANLDLMKGDRFLNIPDIKNKIIPGDKRIYDIHFIEDLAYLATGFGIVVINPEKEEIKDTYYIGQGGASVQVFDISNNEQYIMAATADGIYYTELSNPNLANFNNWAQFDESDGLPSGPIDNIHHDGNYLLASNNGVLYRFENNTWNFFYDANAEQNGTPEQWTFFHLTGNTERLVLCEQLVLGAEGGDPVIMAGRVVFYEQSTGATTFYEGSALQRPQEAVLDEFGRVWIADNFTGLVEINADGEQQYPRRLTGPDTNSSWSVEAQGDGFWIAPAQLSTDWGIKGNPRGAYFFKDGDWSHSSNAKNITDIAIHPNNETIYFASYLNGLAELNGEEETIYDETNSSIQNTEGNGGRRISGLAFDQNGNLWMSNLGAPEPISVKTSNGDWKSYLPKKANGSEYAFDPDQRLLRGFTEIAIDGFNNKWFVVKDVGILVSTCQDPLNCKPGDYRLFKHIDFFNGIPTDDVNCIVNDLEDEIWVGTDDGVAVFYCTSNPMSESCEFSKPILPVTEEEGEYLLEGITINTIEVDGADRKWIGTNQGIQVLSPDGKTTIQNFNTDNSPLISNVIRDMSINGKTGEVIIATNKGVMSYRSDALFAEYMQPSEVIAYPNPIREDYFGPIAIKGLSRGANVKITDVAGNLVFETAALGGQAIWDGNDYLGRRATTGVYLVLSSSEDGTQTIATKLFLVSE